MKFIPSCLLKKKGKFSFMCTSAVTSKTSETPETSRSGYSTPKIAPQKEQEMIHISVKAFYQILYHMICIQLNVYAICEDSLIKYFT